MLGAKACAWGIFAHDCHLGEIPGILEFVA